MNPSPVTPANREKGTPAAYGDTRAQTLSALMKVEVLLKEQGLTMRDVVFMHVYLVGDPASGGKMDFAGMNAAFTQFFGTAAQPNKPARTAIQVAGLASAGALVKIEATAARRKWSAPVSNLKHSRSLAWSCTRALYRRLLRLRNDSQPGLRSPPAVRVFLLRLLVRSRSQDNDVVAVLPIYRGSNLNDSRQVVSNRADERLDLVTSSRSN